MMLNNTWLKLALAVIVEIFATTMLVTSDGFTYLLPGLLAIAGYGVCYYLLTYVTRSLHLGVAYAIWSGAGIVAVNMIGMWFFDTPVNSIRSAGMWMIIAGIAIISCAEKYKKMEAL